MNKKECYENILKHFCGEDCLEYNETSEPLNRWLTELITTEIKQYLQDKLNDYDVGSLEYKIIKGLINE